MNDAVLTRRVRVASLLIDLECVLRTGGLWDDELPAEAAFASTEPFCVDTMDFPQWLQFVFLPRMGGLLHGGQPLPARSGIAEMAEMWFQGRRSPRGPSVVAVLREIDLAIGGASG